MAKAPSTAFVEICRLITEAVNGDDMSHAEREAVLAKAEREIKNYIHYHVRKDLHAELEYLGELVRGERP